MRVTRLTLIAMAIVVAASFLLERLAPRAPWYVFLALPIVAGAALIPIAGAMAKKRGEVIGDERTALNSRDASYVVFRTAYPLSMALGLAIVMSGVESQIVLGAGYALLSVGVVLGLAFGIAYAIISARR